MDEPSARGVVPTLPVESYLDPALFAREQERIFRRHWSVLARREQLARPGDYVCGRIGRWRVFVIRGEDGGLKGFHNICRHRAGPLVEEGAGHCALRYGIRCQYHGWSYAADGALLSAPGLEGARDFEPAAFGLYPIRIAEWRGIVFGCLDDAAPGLAEWLGDVVAIANEFPPLEKMSFYRELTAEGAANWKLYGDNSVEGYHLPFVHTQLNQAVRKYAVELHEKGGFVGFRVEYDLWGNHPPAKGYWIYKFPCLLLHFSDYDFNLEQVYPEGPAQTRLVHWFWRPESALAQGHYDELAEGWRVTMGEDMAICARVQRNLGAGPYRAGVLSPAREPGTIFFQNQVRAALAT